MRAISHPVLQVLLLLTLVGSWTLAQTPGTTAQAQAQSALIRITSPQQHQRQTVNYVTVHYELQNPASEQAGSPNFQVQLDGNAATTDQSFTGITPGRHVITVRLLDANGAVIPNSQTQVEFTVVPTAQNGGAARSQPSSGSSTQTSSLAPHAGGGSVAQDSQQIEEAAIVADLHSLLPVAGIVAFSFLFGSIVSAIKTRP